MLHMCVYMHSRFVENHPIRILEDRPLISEGVLSHGAQATHGSPRAALSREAGTTPPPPLSRPFVSGLGVVVPVTPLDNPHRMITRGKTAFRVVADRLVLTVVTS
jgi:hypothetical protein